MTDLVAELVARAKELAPEDRARLAEELLATLDPGDPTIEAAWSAEIGKRIDEIERGIVDLIPGDQALERIRTSLRR